MKYSDAYLDAARNVIGSYLNSPVQTEKEIGSEFSPEYFPAQLKEIAEAIQRRRENGEVESISNTSIGISCGNLAFVDKVFYSYSSLASVQSQLSLIQREYAIAAIRDKARVVKNETPKNLDAVKLGVRAIPALKRLRAGVERLETGFPELDRALGGGITVPSIVVLGAKPKCGKSTIVATLADNIVTKGGYAYVLDLENGIDRFLRRLMCRRSLVDPESLSNDSFIPPDPWRETENEVLKGALGERLFVDDTRRMPASSLERNIAEISARAEAEGKQFLIILDSLQKLPVENLSDRRAGIDRWMRWLEGIRDKYRATILLTSELKRPTQGQEYKPSEISLKESGDIEYTADLVLSLDRKMLDDEYAAEDGMKGPPATMKIIFNRDGRTGIVADYELVHPHHGVREIPRKTIPIPVKRMAGGGDVIPFHGRKSEYE
jgi:replicative DNA helicase